MYLKSSQLVKWLMCCLMIELASSIAAANLLRLAALLPQGGEHTGAECLISAAPLDG
jgi:hypothetical protein